MTEAQAPKKPFPYFRTLNADEIEVRVAQISEKGAQLLLYKDARCDMNLLDEVCGPMGWKREHSRDNANCTVYIYHDGLCEWVGKEDTGTESNTEAQKGLASDSFKRACVNWGIGRELYTAPFIWIPAAAMDIKVSEFNGKKRYKTFDEFEVQKIAYDENRRITGVAIRNAKTKKLVYCFPAKEKA